eukprot:6204696-Pleurochrysis_carterae.AAC.1
MELDKTMLDEVFFSFPDECERFKEARPHVHAHVITEANEANWRGQVHSRGVPKTSTCCSLKKCSSEAKQVAKERVNTVLNAAETMRTSLSSAKGLRASKVKVIQLEERHALCDLNLSNELSRAEDSTHVATSTLLTWKARRSSGKYSSTLLRKKAGTQTMNDPCGSGHSHTAPSQPQCFAVMQDVAKVHSATANISSGAPRDPGDSSGDSCSPESHDLHSAPESSSRNKHHGLAAQPASLLTLTNLKQAARRLHI